MGVTGNCVVHGCQLGLNHGTCTLADGEQTKFVFPVKKSPCSSARSEVACVNQVITRTCIKLIEDHGIGLTLQQFYYWNCRAESQQRDEIILVLHSASASTQRWQSLVKNRGDCKWMYQNIIIAKTSAYVGTGK